ncbi:hypothetical protein [Amnibacterium sp.]|uniref:hypothetical protein n=1 Tax=Amnibacterium sp. TaxID=1872496 RepID=UPI0026048320|nr:hypothetical protein [Amnibacterium sp.]MCU1474850.1 hypothetical protein [Amnibacterium sp.]
MPARTRDAIVVVVLLVAALGAGLAWHPLGHWVALVVAFAGLLAAAGVYRVRRPVLPPRVRGHAPDETPERPSEAASTPRPF